MKVRMDVMAASAMWAMGGSRNMMQHGPVREILARIEQTAHMPKQRIGAFQVQHTTHQTPHITPRSLQAAIHHHGNQAVKHGLTPFHPLLLGKPGEGSMCGTSSIIFIFHLAAWIGPSSLSPPLLAVCLTCQGLGHVMPTMHGSLPAAAGADVSRHSLATEPEPSESQVLED